MYEKYVHEKLSEKQIRKTDTKKKKNNTKSFHLVRKCFVSLTQKNPRKKITRDIGSSSTEPGIQKNGYAKKLSTKNLSTKNLSTKKHHRDKVP